MMKNVSFQGVESFPKKFGEQPARMGAFVIAEDESRQGRPAIVVDTGDAFEMRSAKDAETPLKPGEQVLYDTESGDSFDKTLRTGLVDEKTPLGERTRTIIGLNG